MTWKFYKNGKQLQPMLTVKTGKRIFEFIFTSFTGIKADVARYLYITFAEVRMILCFLIWLFISGLIQSDDAFSINISKYCFDYHRYSAPASLTEISPLLLASATQATQIQSNNMYSRSHVFTFAKWPLVISRFNAFRGPSKLFYWRKLQNFTLILVKIRHN